MKVTPQTFARLPVGRPWSAYALTYGAAGGSFAVELDPSVPEAACVLERAGHKLHFEVLNDGMLLRGRWDLTVEPGGNPLPPTFHPERSVVIGGDYSDGVLAVRWDDDPAKPELHLLWMRDEIEQRSLGCPDRLLEAVVFGTCAGDEDDMRVAFDNNWIKPAIEELIRTALPLRIAERYRLAAAMSSMEDRIDAGEKGPALLTAWEAAQAATKQMGVASWERLSAAE